MMPMLAAGFFGYREVQRNTERAEATAALATLVELQVATSTLRAPFEVERLASVGIARVGSFGIPTGPIVDATGLDFEGILTVNGDRLELGRSRVQEAIQTASVPQSVRDEFESANLGVDSVRARVAAGVYLAFDEITAAFERVDAVLDDIESISERVAADVVPSTPNDAAVIADLDVLSRVSTTAAGRSKPSPPLSC